MRPRTGFLLVAVLALAVRLAYVAEIRDSVTFRSPVVDAFTYDRDARQVAAEGPGALELPYYQPPAYPLLLGAIYAATGGSWTAPRVLQAAAGAVTVGLVFLMASAGGGRRAGWIAAALLALHGPMIYFEGELLPPAWLLLLETGALLALLGADRRRGAPPGDPGSRGPLPGLIVAALLLGLATAFRPTAALLALGAALWWLRGGAECTDGGRDGRARAGARRAGGAGGTAAVALAFLLPLLPITAANFLGGREPVLVSWNGGINFYLGNGAGSDSLTAIQPGYAWERLQRAPLADGVRGRSEESAWWFRRALSEAAADPAAWTAALGRKAVRFLDARETPRNTDLEADRRGSRILSLPLPGFGILAPLAFLGLAARRAPGRFRALLGVAIAAVAVENLLFFVAGRYRLQAAPALAVLAGVGVDAVWRDRRNAVSRRAIVAVAALALVVHLDLLGDRGIDEARVAINRGVALRHAGDDTRARAEFTRAVALSIGDPDAHRFLGEMALGDGNPERALDHFDRALAGAPDYIRVLLGSAQALEQAGRRDEAEPYYLRARSVDPWSTDVWLNYGVYLVVSGRRAEAREAFEAGLRIDPEDGRLRRNLERLLRGS